MKNATMPRGVLHQDLNDLYLFTLVAGAGSFTAAARTAGLTTSRLSRRIAELERRLGVRLLHRTTRKLALTAVGELYYQHCQAMVSEAEAAAEVIEQVQATPRGRVRVTCPVIMAQTALGPIVVDFMLRYPEVRISLLATDRLIDLIDEAVDVAVRFRAAPLKNSSLVIRSLGESRNYLVASPEFLGRHGRPSQPGALSGLPTLAKSQHASSYTWSLTGRDDESVAVQHQPVLESDDWLAVKQAAVAGLGIAALPHEFCWQELRDGRLERVLPDWDLPSTHVHLLYVSKRGLLPAVRAFIDFAAERLQAACAARPGTEP